MPAPVAAAAAGAGARAAAGAGAARSSGTVAKGASGGGKGAQAADAGLGFLGAKSGGGRTRSAGSKRHSGPQRLLVAEFLLCIVILGLSPVARGKGETKPQDWMKRGTAMCGLFALLGLVSAVGPRAGRAAAALGGLVTVVLMVDQRELFAVVARRLNAPTPDNDDIDGVGGAVGGAVGDAIGDGIDGVGDAVGGAVGGVVGGTSGMGPRPRRGNARAQS